MLAEEWEIARFAASLVRVEYKKQAHDTDLFARRDQAFVAETPERPRGKADRPMRPPRCATKPNISFPIEHHNPMELFASTAVWEGDGKLTVYDKTQGVQNVQHYLCGVFKMKPDDVRVVSPFVGGAFGSGLRPQYQVALAVLAARALERSVRLVLTRRQMYGLGYRPAHDRTACASARKPTARSTRSAMRRSRSRRSTRISIATTPAGPASFIRARTPNTCTSWCGSILPPRRTCARRARRPASMRSNARWTSSRWRSSSIRWSCACAAIRTATSTTDIPYTSKKLRECYRQGADAFGWSKRNAEPRSMRDGSELVGWGMATGIWEALQMECATRIVLTANGHAEVVCAFSDIGTGTYTIMAQVAADMLGLPLDNVTVRLGDSTLPQAPVEGGSWTAASVSHAIVRTAEDVRKELLRLAKTMPNSPLAGAKLERHRSRRRQAS